MKNNRFAKISLLVLSLALILGAVLALSTGAQETEAETKPVIISENVAYQGDFALMYAVDASTATGPVELYVYETEPTDSTPHSYKYTVSEITPAAQTGNLGKAAYVFRTAGVAAAAMSKEFYIQAKDATGAKSEVRRYSVAEYLYERLADASSTEQQKKLYNSVISFGDNAQIVIGGVAENSNSLISKLRYVEVEGGTINGYATGVYPIGTTLTPAVTDGVGAKWAVTTTNEEGKETITNNNTTYTVIDAVKAVLSVGTKIAYRDGYNNLNHLNAGDAHPYRELQVADATVELVTEDKHGTVAKFTLNNRNSAAKLRNDMAYDENAGYTALEFSFDMKVTTVGTSTWESIQLMPNSSSNSTFFRINYYTTNSSTSPATNLDLTNANATSETKLFSGVEPSGWVHVRIVFYQGDSNMYVYINGGDVPFVAKTHHAEWSGDITQIEHLRLAAYEAKGVGATVLIDNYFCGYTKDTLAGE